MNPLFQLGREEPVPVTVRWAAPASEILPILDAALQSEWLTPIAEGRQHVYRLTGSVIGRAVVIRLGLSQAHNTGVPPLLLVTGEILDVPAGGCELDAAVEVDGADSQVWVLVLLALLVAAALMVVAGSGPLLIVLAALGIVGILFGPALRGRSLRPHAAAVASILAGLAPGGIPVTSAPTPEG